ncbi:G5 and 3D domain-containing protein [Gracilibacillus caseinilyticus]|uniref:G5 and 3D domain-containing protein n=1 Tax=Gracilibacillus caseinilyticus TaxID=2932256 RepID=UPI002739801F|nr:G5 and 3D domain-containing protein [Gracilibacillus caseinilyticus]
MKRLLNLKRILQNKDFKYAISLFVIIGFICFSFYELSKAEVTVVQNDEETTVHTHAKTVGDVLNELAIDVGEHDKLSHEQSDHVNSGMQIEHTIAKEVVVNVDGEKQSYYTTADNVEVFLAEQNIELTKNDHIKQSMDTNIEDNLEINIEKAFQITINDGGEEKQVWTTGGTVKNLLASEEIEIGELDRVEPKQSASISEGTAVNITRVEKVKDVEEEEVDYKVVKRSDNSLTKGKEEVVSEGETGVVEKHYEVVLENGEEVSRELVKENVKKESKERIVAIGTKVSQPATTITTASAATNSTPSETVSRGKEEESSKTLYMKATAYNWDCATCDGRGLTSTGYNLKANPNGVVAVDPSVIPLGTKVWVEGYGYAIARDTGGNIKGNKIDLHMSTKQKAASYGSRTVKVKIID